MTTFASFESYGNYASHNYGVNAMRFIDTKGWSFWFSYTTLVAFTGPNGKIVHENDWGTTTGKHLNWIDGGNKVNRLSADDFEAAYKAAFGTNS